MQVSFIFAYIVAVLDRTTLGVSGLEAGDRFTASPGVLSSFVVLQIVVYASAQVPAGLLLDRFGSLPTPGELRALAREPGMHAPTSQMRALRELEPPSVDEGLAGVEVKKR